LEDGFFRNMADRMTEAVSLIDVSIRRGSDMVVHAISCAIERGTWFGLLGANGSGKTTLLRALGGRLPIAHGSCKIHGEELSDQRSARAAQVGFAPPIESLPEMLRVSDAIALVGGDLDAGLGNIGELGEALAIPGLLDRWIGDCSSGMRQRVAIALAFAGGHRIVILDEPFNWLDPVAAFDIRRVLRTRVDGGLTLVTALHDIPTLTTCCDRALIMAEGHAALSLAKDQLEKGAKDPLAFERDMIQALRKETG
jgi:ABC-type multidrug transport system ATPase subunit